jgi:hypothetical protein
LLPKLRKVSAEKRTEFELLVVTHIDSDHIAGTLELMEGRNIDFHAREVWFNGYRHLPDEAPDTLGPVQGERLTDAILKRRLPWNAAFGKAAVVAPATDKPPEIELEDGLTLTVLSPTSEDLARLKPIWEEEVTKAGLDPERPLGEPTPTDEGFTLLGGGPPDIEELAHQPFVEDTAPANASSIALFLEYQGRRLLLSGDAHPSVLKSALERVSPGRKLKLDACKLPHHGSKANVSPELLQALDCKTYLFSTNGAYFQHPDQEAVARVIRWGGPDVELVFNYRTKYNSMWENRQLLRGHGYGVRFPDPATEGMLCQWD